MSVGKTNAIKRATNCVNDKDTSERNFEADSFLYKNDLKVHVCVHNPVTLVPLRKINTTAIKKYLSKINNLHGRREINKSLAPTEIEFSTNI